MNLKSNILWKSEAVPRERTFLDKYVVNATDRKTRDYHYLENNQRHQNQCSVNSTVLSQFVLMIND